MVVVDSSVVVVVLVLVVVSVLVVVFVLVVVSVVVVVVVVGRASAMNTLGYPAATIFLCILPTKGRLYS